MQANVHAKAMMNGDEAGAGWYADERAVRANWKAPPGCLTTEQLAARSGLETLRAMIAGDLPRPPITEALDFLLVHAEHGRVVFQGAPAHRHYNPMGIVHGGWFATLLDSAVGCAVHSILPPGKGYTSLELKVNFVRALSAEVPRVRAEGVVVHGAARS